MRQHDCGLRFGWSARAGNFDAPKDEIALIEALIRLKIHIGKQPMVAEVVPPGLSINQGSVRQQFIGRALSIPPSGVEFQEWRAEVGEIQAIFSEREAHAARDPGNLYGLA